MRTLLALLPLLALAQAPDRPARPDEWGYRPADGAVVATNPPSLTWVSDGNQYRFAVQWSPRADFSGAVTVAGIPWSVYTHNQPLAPGAYFWRYRVGASAWSKARRFTIPADAVAFPQPTIAELRRRIPADHPRLFVTSQDLPRLRAWSQGAGAAAYRKLLQRAAQLLNADPTPEPEHMGASSDPKMVQYWWSNRVQTMQACQEAEVLAFAFLLSADARYKDAARRWVMHLAAWNPDGPTNWRLNDEAAMPILHRLARAYDWAYAALSDDDRAQVRAALPDSAENVQVRFKSSPFGRQSHGREPNWAYLKDVSKSSIPPQWHVEASTSTPSPGTPFQSNGRALPSPSRSPARPSLSTRGGNFSPSGDPSSIM